MWPPSPTLSTAPTRGGSSLCQHRPPCMNTRRPGPAKMSSRRAAASAHTHTVVSLQGWSGMSPKRFRYREASKPLRRVVCGHWYRESSYRGRLTAQQSPHRAPSGPDGQLPGRDALSPGGCGTKHGSPDREKRDHNLPTAILGYESNPGTQCMASRCGWQTPHTSASD